MRTPSGSDNVIFTLDSSAMIAFLRDEAGADLVEAELLNPKSQCHAHVLNLCEVFYDTYRLSGHAGALQALEDLRRFGVIEHSEMPPVLWQQAGTIKALRKRVSLADCFAVALAQHLGATILTSDHHEFDALAAQGVCDIRFIR